MATLCKFCRLLTTANLQLSSVLFHAISVQMSKISPWWLRIRQLNLVYEEECCYEARNTLWVLQRREQSQETDALEQWESQRHPTDIRLWGGHLHALELPSSYGHHWRRRAGNGDLLSWWSPWNLWKMSVWPAWWLSKPHRWSPVIHKTCEADWKLLHANARVAASIVNNNPDTPAHDQIPELCFRIPCFRARCVNIPKIKDAECLRQ